MNANDIAVEGITLMVCERSDGVTFDLSEWEGLIPLPGEHR